MEYGNILEQNGLDYLLVCCTNEFLVEYPALSENARYTLTGFSGSTGDALISRDNIYLFVDGRYHTQAEMEAKENVVVVKLQLGQRQDDEIKKLIDKDKVLGIVSKKVSQARLEKFSGYNIKLLSTDPINNFTETHTRVYTKAFEAKKIQSEPAFYSNLEEVSYLTGLRDFSNDCSAKIWAKLFVSEEEQKLLTNDAEEFLKGYEGKLLVDKNTINAYDYNLIKNPVHRISPIRQMKSIKSSEEIEAYKKAFKSTDKAVLAIRNYIENNENLSEFDISTRLREEFIRYGAKNLSFNSIVAINQNSALAHYAKNSKDVILTEGSLVLIDCGAYYESGLATDITRVFVKGRPNELQRQAYTTVLKAFLNAFNYNKESLTGFELDTLAHKILDNALDGFTFGHGLGHGIGINVHEAPPNLSQNEIAKSEILDGMTFTIEPGIYNSKHFGIRLENSCYKMDGKIHSFVKMGYEGKLIDYDLLTKEEQEWLKDFEIL